MCVCVYVYVCVWLKAWKLRVRLHEYLEWGGCLGVKRLEPELDFPHMINIFLMLLLVWIYLSDFGTKLHHELCYTVFFLTEMSESDFLL